MIPGERLGWSEGWCPLCELPARQLRGDSGLCKPCHLDIYPKERKGLTTQEGLKRLRNMRPEHDYQIVDEGARVVWASDLVRRYIDETRPKGRMGGGY